MNKTEAIKATKNGAIAACISATMTIAVTLIAINSDADGRLALWNDPFNFLDVILILGCAFGMYKQSRAASILIFVYFISAKIIISFETQSFNGLGVSLIFLYFYGKAIQGSFVYHKICKTENPDYKATSKLTYIVGIPAVSVLIFVIVFAAMSTTGIVPSTRVQSGNELSGTDVSTLIDNGIIYNDDEIKYFYSQGLTSILEGGNILTQNRVILYTNDEGEGLQVYEIYLDEITDIELESQGDALNYSVYKVKTTDPERWIKLFLSTEQKGDNKFVTEALKYITNRST